MFPQFNPAGALAATQALLAAAVERRTADDRTIDALLAAEDAILALPQESSVVVVARAQIAVRRLHVAAEDQTRPEDWCTLLEALRTMEESLNDGCSAILGLVLVAEAHRNAILAGNAEGGRRDALDPSLEEEMQIIERAIRWGRVVADSIGSEPDVDAQSAFVPLLIPNDAEAAAPVAIKPKPRGNTRTKAKTRVEAAPKSRTRPPTQRRA